VLKKASLYAIVIGFLCASAYAQFWPTPSYTTPDTPVNCSECQSGALNLPTPGWHDPVVRYVGRFVSSEYVADFQQVYRTARAKGVVFSPDGSRIAVRLGQGVATYDTGSFLSRLDSHEALIPVSTLGVNACNRTVSFDCSTGVFETFLPFERYFYAENGSSGWTIALSDGQDRLGVFDLDDRGLLYVAYDQYGWGVASDLPGTLAGGKLMSSWQDKNSFSNWAPATVAYWVKDGDTYYALAMSSTSQTTTHVFKVPSYSTVTEMPGPPPAPKQTPLGLFSKPILSLARGNGGRTAIITDSYHAYIYDNHSLVTNGAPLQMIDFTGTATVSNVVSDGTNFWVAGLSLSGGIHMMLTKLAPSGATTYSRTDTVTTYGSAQPNSLQYKDGYLTEVTSDTDGLNIRMYKVATGNLVEMPTVASISNYFKNQPGFAQHAPHMTLLSATPLVYGGKLYLIVNGEGLGDVYQIRTDDTVNVGLQGTAGPANANAPAKQTGDVFYGDAVKMTAALSSGLTGGALSWNFGAVHDPANTLPGTFGAQVIHQYTGLSKTDVAAPVNITVTNTANGVTGSTALALKTGTARVKYGSVGGPKYLLGSGVPIVSDDSFYDASDGDTTGHYTEWRIGADAATISAPAFVPQLATPVTAVPGGCGQHTLSMTAHYGYSVYSAANVDFPVSISAPFTYNASAFVPAVDVSYNAATGNEEFVSTSRAAGALASARTVTYTWDVVDANGTAVATIAPQTGTTAVVDTIPKYPVSKSLFTQPGYKGRLTLSVSGADPCSQTGASMPSQQATSQALVPPDAQITAVCNNPLTGVCQYTITSPSNVMTSDAWTFAWTATSGTPSSGNSSSLTVSYYNIGNFNGNVVVTNKAGLSKTVPFTANITTAASQCPTFSSSSSNGATLVGITYAGTGANTTCVDAVTTTCVPNENIQFSTFFYPRTPDDSCLSTVNYTWLVDGAGAGSGSTLTTSFGSGTHTIALTFGAGSQSVQLTKGITIGTPPPPPPPACGTLSALNTTLDYQGQSASCHSGGACTASDTVNFTVSFFNYNSFCATHTYSWTFDGASGGSFTTPGTSHVFSTQGTHTYSVSVSNGTSRVTLSGTLTVSGGTPPPPACAVLVNGQNVFFDYLGGTSGCHAGGANCTAGEQVTASLTYWNYSPSCGTHTYTWTVDGEPVTGNQSATFSLTNGNHTVAVTVNNGNPNVTLSQVITVGEPAKADYKFDFTIVPLSLPPFSYAFSVVVTPDGPTKPTQWRWDFGDGTPASTAGAVQTHTFKDGDEYTITVTAIDGLGGIVSHTIQSPSPKRRGVRH
jgi:hypothetical protein